MDDKVYNKEEDNLLLKDKSFKPCDNYMSSLEKLATVEERFIKEYTAFEQKNQQGELGVALVTSLQLWSSSSIWAIPRSRRQPAIIWS